MSTTTDREVLITRVIDAPRELVFRAWTDPDELRHWYAPRGCTVTFRRFDFRLGGTFHSCIRATDGQECWCTGMFREIVAPQRIVHTMSLCNEQGRPVSAANAGKDPEWPAETVVTVTFTEQEGKTTLTLHQTVSETLARRTGAYPSWLEMLDHLAGHLGRG